MLYNTDAYNTTSYFSLDAMDMQVLGNNMFVGVVYGGLDAVPATSVLDSAYAFSQAFT